MREVSGRMFALCADVARLGGVATPDLFRGLAVPTMPSARGRRVIDPAARGDFGAFLALLARLSERLGGDEALARAFAQSPVVLPELLAFAADFSSPLELSRFYNTVLMPGYFTCLHTVMATPAGSSYHLWLVPHQSYGASSALIHAIAGLLRGLPCFLGLAEAKLDMDERDGARAILFRVTLPEGPGKARQRSAMRAEDNERANTFIDALAKDVDAYRQGAALTEEILQALGRGAEEETTRAGFAALVVDVLVRTLALEGCVFWGAEGTTRLAQAGTLGRGVLSADLVLAGERLGRLDVPADCPREALDPVLPLVAWTLHRRALNGTTSAGAGLVVPPVHVRPAWRLTKRQTEVVALVVAGLSNGQIATQLGCAVGTIEDRLTAIYAKTGVDGRLGLAVRVLDANAEATAQATDGSA